MTSYLIKSQVDEGLYAFVVAKRTERSTASSAKELASVDYLSVWLTRRFLKRPERVADFGHGFGIVA